MFGQTFYHSLTRKYVSVFGSMFDDIYVRRQTTDGTPIQQIRVPISYSPKQKWLYLLARPTSSPVAVQLPRLGFEILSIDPDPDRSLIAINKNTNKTDNANRMNTQYTGYPVKYNFELYAVAKNADDAAQIYEQILPYFHTPLTIPMTLVPEMGKTHDVTFTLTGMSLSDAYQGDFQERRAILWTFNFAMDGFIFGPVKSQGPIKRVQVDTYAVGGGSGPITDKDVMDASVNGRLVVMPGLTADGKPTTKSEESIPYQQINADDDYGFIEEFYSFTDGDND